MEDETSEKRNNARLAILELANMISVPMSLNAVVRLNVADVIWQGGSNTPLSASEILARVLPTGDAENLQRVLRMLTSYGVFDEHVEGSERKYSLTDVGRTLVTDAEGLSYAAYVLQHHQDELLKAWPLVHEAVVDPTTEPFAKANGEPAYSYYGKKPEMNDLMLKAMSGVSVPFMRAILKGYDGFNGIQKLVDVGGSAGDCLRMIMTHFPNVREGVNFDLPEVVAKAPPIPGVTHVGGDMFKSIPSGDAIFMKDDDRLRGSNDVQTPEVVLLVEGFQEKLHRRLGQVLLLRLKGDSQEEKKKKEEKIKKKKLCCGFGAGILSLHG